MDKINLTCIVCPAGCRLTVEKEGKGVKSVIGNVCARGKDYAFSECTNPVRTLTTTVKVDGCDMVSVRSDKPLPKDKLCKYVEIINKVCLIPPVNIGDIIIENIDNTGVNIISTKNIK